MKKKKPWVPRAPDGSRICQHCHRFTINRPRGLCRACYYDPAVRFLYGARKGFYPEVAEPVPDFSGYEPTSFPPGTEDRIEVMRERVGRGVPLCHPLDAGYRERIIAPTRGKCKQVAMAKWERVCSEG